MSNPFDNAQFVPARLVVSHDDLRRAMLATIKDMEAEEIREEVAKSGTRCNLVHRALRRYAAAERASLKFGLIGVGCLTFADARLAKFCKRVNLTV